jgi:hypothetical protein
MRKTVYVGLLLIMLLPLIGGMIACKSESTTTPEEQAILVYADPATEATLKGLSEDNLEKYTQYGNAQFKAAVTQGMLDQVSSQINSQLGTYESKEFLRTEEQQGYIIVHYKANYSKGEVGVRMVFDKDHLVAGQFFE